MTTTPHPIFTWGYTGSGPEDELGRFVNALDARVIDVRLSDRSRVPRWAGPALTDWFGGWDYQWVPAFGNRNYKTPGAPIVLDQPEEGLRVVLPLLKVQPVILLCSCAYRDRATCHRLVVADLLAKATGATVEHLPARFSQWQPAKGAPAPLDRTAAALTTGEAWDGAPAIQGRLL